MENIKNKIEKSTKIEQLILKLSNHQQKEEERRGEENLNMSSLDISVSYLHELQLLFNDFNKLNDISVKILESHVKKNLTSFSNSIKINDDLIDSYKAEIDDKLYKVNKFDDTILKTNDKIYKIKSDIDNLYKIQFILLLGFIYLLYCKLF
tara:strand:+ start:450 stop:902 length:453 start_codon:yes stop_codon:yes gene_type:complete